MLALKQSSTHVRRHIVRHRVSVHEDWPHIITSLQSCSDILNKTLNSSRYKRRLPVGAGHMILEIISGLVPFPVLAPAVKPSPQPYVPCVPCNLAVKPVPRGVNSRGRYELVAEVEGPEGGSSEGLAAEVEHSF
jgi:hypothetical protein